MEHRLVPPATLHRMLDKAHADGVAVLGVAHHPSKPGILGAHVSSSRPDQPPYAVWLYGEHSGCDCPGYEKHGYCKHWALVLDRAGLLPDDDPEPPASASASPDPWDPPVDLVSRRQAAAADVARRQAAAAVRGKRVRPVAA
jgi:hypothetical protein